MNEQATQALAIQKLLGLSEQEALKVLIFITGMNVGKALLFSQVFSFLPTSAGSVRDILDLSKVRVTKYVQSLAKAISIAQPVDEKALHAKHGAPFLQG